MRKAGKSPKVVSKETGLTKKTILRIMEPIDLGKLPLRTVAKISIALNCRAGDLFEKPDLSPEKARKFRSEKS